MNTSLQIGRRTPVWWPWTGRLLAVALMCAAAAPMLRADDAKRRPQRKTPASKSDAKPQDKKPPKKEEPEVVAIVGGEIHTVTREVVRAGTILIKDGKIDQVGQDIDVPENARVINAEGKIVTPGFVSINMSGVGLRTGGTESKYADYLDPFDRNLKLALGVGITTGCMQLSSSRGFFFFSENERFPGLDPEGTLEELAGFNTDFGPQDNSTCPCCGLPIVPAEPITPPRPVSISPQKHAVVKMSYGSLDGMLVSPTVFFDVRRGALSGSLNRHSWRESIAKAKKYLQDVEQHKKKVAAGDKKSKPPRKSVTDNYLKLVQKETALRTVAYSVDEIRDMIDLAEELDYRLVLDDVTEGWLVAKELSEGDVGVVITPRRQTPPAFGREDSSGSSIESSRIFEQAGVPFAVSPIGTRISMMGLAGRDLTSLPLEAAFCVRGGCSERAALAAMTIAPARMLGLDDRIGSIEQGKDADILILTGNPLDYRTYVETAVVNGRVVYERDNDRVLPTADGRS